MEKFYMMIGAEGTGLPDSKAAAEHARQVACELMKGVERSRRPWRLRVRDGDGVTIEELLFASVDRTLDHLEPHLRGLIESISWRLGELNETVIAMNVQRNEFHAFLAGLNRRPFLVPSGGRRVMTTAPEHDAPPRTKTRPRLVAARGQIVAG
jgi:hypothetical protein